MVARCFVYACLFNLGQAQQCEGDVCHDQENVEAASGGMLLQKSFKRPMALSADSSAPMEDIKRKEIGDEHKALSHDKSRDSKDDETETGDEQKALSHHESRDAMDDETETGDEQKASNDESRDAVDDETVAEEESGSNITAMKLQVDLDRQFCQDQPLTEEGWKDVQSHCCMYTLDLFSRRLIEQLDLDICEEGCYNGFFPWFHCLNDGTTLADYKNKIIANPGEACHCLAPRGQCGVGPARDCSEFARDGPVNPAWHRRRRCGTVATTTTTTGPPGATTVTTTTIASRDRVCGLPARVKDFSLIVLNDAVVSAHEIYSGLAIGGNLYDGTPSQTTSIHGASFALNVASSGNWNFKAGVSTTEALSDVFDWSHFEWLARNMNWLHEDGYVVRVFKEGGTYSANGQPSWGLNFYGQGEDNGKTLLVFHTNEDIRLIGSQDGRQFGPSVLAPFSIVTLDGSAGFADGFIIAKQFGPSGTYPTVGNNAGQLQLHGDGYKGPFECKEE